MKKIYIRPITEKFATEVAQLICASPQYTLKRYGQWGASTEQSQYGNNQWLIEGHTGQTVANFEAVEMGGDDTDDLYTRSNSGLFE